MAKQELLIIDALKKIFPEASWSWVIPALRRSPLIWGELESDNFLQYLDQEIGSEPSDWTPGRIGVAALNRESTEKVDWPIHSFDDLSAGLRNLVNQTYQDFENRSDQVLDISEAFQLCLALFGEKDSGKTWQEILNQYSSQNSWLFALSCLFDLVDDQQDLLRVLPPETGMQVLLSRPLTPSAVTNLLTAMMAGMDPVSQEKWIKVVNKEVPDLAPIVAKTLLTKQKSEPTSIQESVTLSLLNQLAGNTETALELLKDATDQNQKLHGKLAANLNKVRTGMNQPQVGDKAWQELTSTINSPEGMNDNVQEISDIIRSLLDNKYYTAAGDLISKLKDPLPEHPELLTVLAEYALSQDQKTRAGQLALLALEKGTGEISPPVSLSSVLLQLNLLDDSVQAAQSYLSKHPNHVDTHLVLAEALYRLGNHSLASKQAQIASVLNPDDISLLRKMAEYQEGAEAWKDALETHANILSKFHSTNEAKSQPEAYLPLKDLFSFASCAYAAQQPKRAVTACKQILDQQPEHSSAHALIGKSLLILGKEDEGFAYLNRAVEISPDLEQPWIALAESQLVYQTPERAIQTLKSGLTAASTRALVLLKLGEIQANHLNQSKALETFQDAAVAAEAEQVDQKTAYDIQYGLGRSFYTLGHLERARITFKNLQKQFPANGKINAIYGKLLLDMDNPQEALPYLADVVDQNPQEIEPYLQHADAHLRIGENPDVAAESLNKALILDPENKIAHALLGEAQIAAENYQDAIKSFQKAYDTSLKADPSWSPRISLGIGTAAIQLGKIETAIASLKEGYEKYPQNLPLSRSLAEAYQSANLTSNALKAAKRTAEIAPHDPETLSWIAEFTLALGSPEQGISALKELVRIEPCNYAAHIQLGKAYASAGNEKEAFSALSNILKLEEVQPEDLLLAGDELIKLGNFETGMKCLKKAANICEANPTPSPLLPKIWARLAAGHEMNDKPKQALELLDQAISADLDHPEWRIQKADLLIRQDRFQAAIASLSNALDLRPEDPELHAKMAHVQHQIHSNEEAFYHAQEALSGFQADSTKKENLADILAYAADLACATLRIDQAEEILSNLDLNQLKKGGKLLPSQVHSLCLSGEIALDQNQEVKAAEISNLLVSMEIDNPRVSALKARILNRQGSLNEAQESFFQAVETWHNLAAGEKSFNT
ncbi:MAG: tetratricopeptide repeat protein, partial [Anaerolineales bacterium]|nr:tetratricopeptide repeat protein [Anaerolineales bacterium]